MFKKSLKNCIRSICSVIVGMACVCYAFSSYSQCGNGITNGSFDDVAPGEYGAPGYINGWSASGSDKIKIVTQDLANGALIRSRGAEQFSLEQTIYSVKPLFTYSFSFNYGNWTNGCNTSARAAMKIEVYADNSATPFFTSEEYQANTTSFATLQFTTPAAVSTLRIRIFDPGSPPPTCGAVISNMVLVSPLVVNTSSAAVKCFGESTGSFTVDVSGGAAPYTANYTVNGNPPVAINLVSGSASVNNLPAGNYTVNITDGNNCTVSRVVTVAQPATALSVTANAVMCFGQPTGSVIASAAGGTPGYTYTLGAETNTTGVFSNLPAGTYTITATDANGCQTSQTVTVAQPANAITAAAAPSPVSCFGETNGSIQVTASGGIAPYSYSLNGATNTTGLFTGLPAGSYSITVTDANNCPVAVYTTITQPAQIIPSVNKTDVTCNGGSDGSISVTATGSTGTFTFTLNGVSNNSGVFTNLPADSYTVFITDGNSCTVEIQSTIEQPTHELSATADPVMCFGEATGSISVTASGGTPGYTYTLNGLSNNSGYFSNLAAGTYDIAVTDAKGCSFVITTSIAQPGTPVSLSATSTNTSCTGGTDGTITAVAGGGVPGYTYTVNDISNSTGFFNNLGPGNYTVIATDANGCPTSFPVTIAEPPVPLTATSSAAGARCFGDANGSIQVSAAGGTPGYIYLLNNVSNTTGIFTGLTAGTYTILVTDANGCSVAVAATVTQPTTALSASAQPARCFGDATGSVTVTASGGTPAYTYTLNGTTNTSGTFSNLPAGTYSITVTDANNCSTTVQASIMEPSAALTASLLEKRDVDCFGTATGMVRLTASGGVSGYSFTVNGITNNTGVFDNLPAGNYTADISDMNGCQTTLNFQIAETSIAISASYVATPVKCFGEANGSLTVSASGGSPGYTYTLGGTTNATGIFTNLAAGSYTIYITDQKNCTIAITAAVSEPATALNAIATPARCFSEPTGSIVVTATGGTPGYTYRVNNTANNTGVFTGLPAGTYVVTVIDANNCSAVTMATIAEPASAITAEVMAQMDVSCYGDASGSVSVSASGGVPGYVFTLNGASNTSGTFTGLAAGAYTIFVTDINGCRTQLPVTIRQPPAALIAAQVVTSDVTCSGESNGTIRVTAAGGTPGYTYTLNGISNNTGIFTNLPANTYTVIVRDANNCTVTVNATVTGPLPVSVTAVTTDVSCFGEANGTISANALGGSAGYTYTLNGTSNNSGVFTGLPAGSYVIHVRDINGCTGLILASINQPEQLTATAVKTDVTWPGETDGTITVTAAGGNSGYTYTVDGESNTSGIFTALASGIYSITVTDAQNCSVVLEVEIGEPTVVDLTPAVSITPEGKKVTITATLRHPFKDDVVITLGYAGTALSTSDYLLQGQYQTIRIPAGSLTTTDRITVHALSDAVAEQDENILISITTTSDDLVKIGNGAEVIIQDVVPDDPPSDISIPENKDLVPDPLVSPNDDGTGDFFNIENIISFPDNEVVIYNRWGNALFKVAGYNNSDKAFRGYANIGMVVDRQNPVVDGVYYYVIYTYKTVNGIKEQRLNKGYIILRR